MIERLHAIFTKKTKLIVIISGVVVICLAIAIPTGLSIQKREQINKQQVLKIEEFEISQAKAAKIAQDKRIADKVIADKVVSDKIIADKKIADETLRLAKIEATKVAQKSVADEKLRVANLNVGVTLTRALAIGKNLYPSTNFKSLSNTTQTINGKEYYVFKLFDLDWNDEGSDWYFCVRKSTGKAFRYYSNNTLMADDATVTSPNTTFNNNDTGMTLDEAKVIGNNLRGEGIYEGTVLTPLYDYTVVINGGDFYVFQIYNEYAADGKEGVNWNLCISKASGKAFKQLPDKTLRDY